jgi:hypothetical protein
LYIYNFLISITKKPERDRCALPPLGVEANEGVMSVKSDVVVLSDSSSEDSDDSNIKSPKLKRVKI